MAKLAQPETIFDLLNFRISEVYNVSGSLVTRLCEGELGITREEWAFIAMLAALGPMSPSEITAQTTADRSQASRTLRALTDKKLIHRDIVASDRRRSIVRLSETGRELYDNVFPRVVELHHAVLSSLSESELETLALFIWKLQVRALEVQKSGLVAAHADRRRGGSRKTWKPAAR